MMLLLSSCNTNLAPSGFLPTVTTGASSAISSTSAQVGLTIVNISAVTEVGILYSKTVQDPTLTNGIKVKAPVVKENNITLNITALQPSTKYYYRAYATDGSEYLYGNRQSFTTNSSSGTVTDIDGNLYGFLTIGTQTWMIENLKTTKLNDGSNIPNVTDATVWKALLTPGYCFYNNDVANKDTYGALYNGYTISTGKIAPSGWHVPTDAEWTILENYLIANGFNYDGTTVDNKIAKSLATTTGWITSTNAGAIGNDLTKNNRSSFSAVPGGYRYNVGGFDGLGYYGLWWSSTEFSATYAWYRSTSYLDNNMSRNNNPKIYGFSVRCVRDY